MTKIQVVLLRKARYEVIWRSHTGTVVYRRDNNGQGFTRTQARLVSQTLSGLASFLDENYERERRNVRDLLAANAPKEIPDWFAPKLPALPELPGVPEMDLPYNHFSGPDAQGRDVNVSTLIRASMSRFLRKLSEGEDPGKLDVDYPTLETHFKMPTTALDAVCAPFYKSVESYREALKVRETVRYQETIAQWPWCYADLVLARRGK